MLPFKSSSAADQFRIETSLGAEFLNYCCFRTEFLQLPMEILQILL